MPLLHRGTMQSTGDEEHSPFCLVTHPCLPNSIGNVAIGVCFFYQKTAPCRRSNSEMKITGTDGRNSRICHADQVATTVQRNIALILLITLSTSMQDAIRVTIDLNHKMRCQSATCTRYQNALRIQSVS